jgi:hypothetical protein
MCPRITWEQVADPWGRAEHTLGTTALDNKWPVSRELAFDDMQVRLTKYSLLAKVLSNKKRPNFDLI